MNDYKSILNRDGFVKIRSTLTTAEISRIKAKLCNMSENQRVRQVSELISDPDVQRLLNDNNLLKVLRDLYTDPVFYPSLQTQFNSFTQKRSFKRRYGLHIDGANELKFRSNAFRKHTPTWTNIGFYFQDAQNSGYGGGICGSTKLYKLIRYLLRMPFGFTVASLILKLAKKTFPDFLLPEIKTEPGDFVVFDNRFPHASSVGKKIVEHLKSEQKTKQTFLQNIPRQNNKLVLYVFAGDREHIDSVINLNFMPSIENKIEIGDFDYQKAMQFEVDKFNEHYQIPFVSRNLEKNDA